MLSLVLDSESEQYLVEILAQEKITSDDLIKCLLRDRWQSLQPQSKEHLEPLILEGLESGDATPMTAADWSEIRATVRQNHQDRAQHG